MDQMFDIAVIGGGINGCGIARDASGRGLKVALFEQDDLASATSQWSSKLIHGGLRYLEHYKFRLVREALIEREVLLNIAPHIIWPLRFVLPHHKGLRPAWLLRLGLFLYDNLGGRKILPATCTLDLRSDATGKPLKAGYATGFEYSDCWVNDARMVVLNAMDAKARGATIHTRTRVVAATRSPDHWNLTARNIDTGEESQTRARIIINAAGPWVASVIGDVLHTHTTSKVRLVQGSHIVVSKLFDHDRPYIFQNADGRIIFAIPYERDFTLIGTTDQDYQGDPAKVAISDAEVAYLCEAAGEYFTKAITPADVVWRYSGVRPLYDDGASKAQEATRDYVLTLDAGAGQAPLLSVFGGKITTYRKLSEAVLDKLAGHLPAHSGLKGGWTGAAYLPGGDFAPAEFEALVERIATQYPFLAQVQAWRLARHYGTRSFVLLGDARSAEDLGRDFGAGLSEAEIRYLMREEWAVTAEDVIWRRSKLGLRLDADQIAAIASFMAEARTDGLMTPASTA
ncbi:MAG: glycerol-3-phosphate dehydrogenase [Bosea sp. (in: a-proteobacteria)]